MAKCSFCGTDIHRGTGKMYVKKDGVVFYFCSLKCEKNLLKLGRQPQKTKWTGAFHTQKQFVQKTAAKKAKKEGT
ncbi:MAG: 50S ribosomal protein L24e [Candidatus Micrarchaeota archaeon]